MTHTSAQDTVPLVLWCAGEHLDDCEEALWLMVSALGAHRGAVRRLILGEGL